MSQCTNKNCSVSIYETHPYYFDGTFKSLTDKIPEIAELGINVIYLMPIWKITTGSPKQYVYGILDYYTIDSSYGTTNELKTLINTIHSYGMKIIFDMVTVSSSINSVPYNNNWTLNILLSDLQNIASNYGWTLQYKNENGYNVVYQGQSNSYTYNFYGIIINNTVISFTSPYIWGPATDRSNPQVIEYFTNIAKYYVQEYNIDGWRIDVPGDSHNKIVFPDNHSSVNLLNSIIDNIRIIKHDALFISEPTVPYGTIVDMEYWNLPFTGIMENLIGNNITTTQLLTQLNNDQPFNSPLYTLESHDITRLNTTYPLYNKNFITLISTLTGAPFIQTGQEIGATTEWSNATVNWNNGNYNLRNHYKKVLTLRNSNNAIKYGSINNIFKSGDNIYAYSRIYNNEKAIVLLNFSNTETISTLNTPFPNNTIIEDILTNELFTITDSTNFIITIPPYSSRILTIQQQNQLSLSPIIISALLIGAFTKTLNKKNI